MYMVGDVYTSDFDIDDGTNSTLKSCRYAELK